MPGDASTRSYARLTKNDQTTILIEFAASPDGPALYDGKSSARLCTSPKMSGLLSP